MFWNNPKKQTAKQLKRLKAEILLIMQSGKILFTSDQLKRQSNNWLGGAVMEVMIAHPELPPFFIYYENEDYYAKMAGGIQALSENFERYRSEVSVAIGRFLVLHMAENFKKDIRHPRMHFSHNRIHTNVIAYVQRLGQWYPIQHCSDESDSATEKKVALVNSGQAEIYEFVAMDSPSPS